MSRFSSEVFPHLLFLRTCGGKEERKEESGAVLAFWEGPSARSTGERQMREDLGGGTPPVVNETREMLHSNQRQNRVVPLPPKSPRKKPTTCHAIAFFGAWIGPTPPRLSLFTWM